MTNTNIQNGLLIGLTANLKSQGTAYNSLKKISNYLYEIHYSNINYKDGEKYYKEKYTPINAACSSLRKGNFIGRNFDWTYDNYASFIVYTQATDKRHGVVGVANGLKTLTPEIIDSGVYSKEYSYIPFALHDGINDEGLVCNVNIVPAGDKGLTTGTDPSKPDMCVLMLVRYILDYASNVDEAIELIKSRNIIGINTAIKTEEVHFMISDPNKTVVVEFIDNEIKVIENQNIMTNFYLYDFDGNTITGFKENREIQPNETTLTAHAAGVERYDILSEVYSELQDKQDILDAMQEVWYTNTYKDETTPKWYSEYTGDTPYGDITIYMPPNNTLLNQAFDIGKNNYEIREREDELTWQTVHTSVYDIENKQLTLMFQENNSKHIFNFVEQKLPLTVTFNADGQPYSIVSITDGQSVSAPRPNPTSESGNFMGWLENESKVSFPYNVVNDTTLTAKFSKASIYTISFDFSQQYPEYTYEDNAVGMIAGAEEWDEIFGIYPCLFADGEEIVKLDPNDFTKDIDGNTVDITSGSMGDVMICFPRMDLNISMVNNIVTISLTDELDKEGFTHYAHQYNGKDKDKFYVGAYECGVIDNKMVSLSGLTPSASNLSNYRNYAKNKSTVGGYNVFSYYQLLYIQCLMILKYKSINSQEAVGYGICKDSFANTGLANSLGMNYGVKSNMNTVVKLFGLENLWANKYCWIDGARTNNGVLQTSKFDFNINNWEDVSPIPTTTYYGNPTKIIGNSEGGFFALGADGQSPISESNGKIRLGDMQNIANTAYMMHGGMTGDGFSTGIFCNYVRYSVSQGIESFMGSRLMFI